MVVNVTIHGSGESRRYYIPSPMGGYMQITEDEVNDGVASDTLRIHRPTAKRIEELREEINREIQPPQF